MSVRAWDRPGPVAQPGHVNPLPDALLQRPVFLDRPVRGERIGSCRMLCGTWALEAVSAIGLVVSLALLVR
jgi:hypothetical protein